MSTILKGRICTIISAILYGLMPLIAHVAYEQGSNALSVAFYRFLFGSAILFAVCLYKNDSFKLNTKQIFHAIAMSVVFTLTVLLLYISYSHIESGLATTLHFTYPLFVVVILVVVFKEKLSFSQIICLVLCVMGMAMLYKNGESFNIKGAIIALLSGLAYAFYIVFIDKSELKQLPATVSMAYISLFSALEVFLIALATHQLVYSLTCFGWSVHVIMAILTIPLAAELFQIGILYCGPAQASILSTFEPLTGTIAGILFLSEMLSWSDCLGMGCILLATIIIAKNNV